MSHLPSSYGAEGKKAEDRKWEKEILIERYIRKPTWRRRHLLFPLCIRPTCVSVYLYLSIDLFSPFYCLPALSGKRCCISSSHFHAPLLRLLFLTRTRIRQAAQKRFVQSRALLSTARHCAHTRDGNRIFWGGEKEKKKNQSGAPRRKKEKE